MITRRWLPALAAVVLVCCGAALGASHVMPQQAVQAPAFRSGTLVVEVDAIVTDRDGKFVEGLLPDDFEVQEEGLPQTIQSMYVVEGTVITPLYVGGISRGERGEETAMGIRPPTTAAAAAPPRVFVLFFDQEHLDQSSYKQVQTAAERFLLTQFQPGDIGGVLVGSTMVGNKLTSDRDALVAAVRGIKLSVSATQRRNDLRDWPRMTEVEAIRIALYGDANMLEQVVRRAARESSAGGRQSPDLTPNVQEKARFIVNQIGPAAGRTLTALGALTTGLGRAPGRKTVVFITEGFMFEQSWGELRQLVGVAARSNVRIYSLDALGLRRRDPGTDLSLLQPNETGASVPAEAYDTVQEGPNTLANDTGGYAIRGTNNFAGALAEIARDTSHYYVLGYSPANPARDGKFHRITVRVKRSGVQVRARSGYLATPPAATPEPPAAAGGAQPAAKPAGEPVPTPVPPPSLPPAAAATRPAGAEAAPPGVPADPGIAPPAPPPTAPAGPIALRPDSSRRVRVLASGSPSAGPATHLASEGWDRYGKGDLEGAERLLGQAAREGAAPWVSYALGFAQAGLRKPYDAVRSWEDVRASVPEFQPVYLDLADAYLQLNEVDRAVETLRAAEGRWPADGEVLNALGTLQVRRNTLLDAIETFEKAARDNPEDPLAFFNLGRTYELRYFAMRRFSRPSARWVDNPELLNKAIENYEVCTRLGGPYEADARAAIDRLRGIK